jgi:transcriptional regulator with XRE-family HTH domain
VNHRDEKVLISFGKNLQKVRLRKKMTQEELSYQADLSLSQIARIETGRINPTLCTILVLAKALGVKAEALMDFDY